MKNVSALTLYVPGATWYQSVAQFPVKDSDLGGKQTIFIYSLRKIINFQTLLSPYLWISVIYLGKYNFGTWNINNMD